jgi:hypothetical protein
VLSVELTPPGYLAPGMSAQVVVTFTPQVRRRLLQQRQ